MNILAIDPGSRRIGYSLYNTDKHEFITCTSFSVESDGVLPRLNEIHNFVKNLGEMFSCDEVIVEKMFINNKNAAILLAAQMVIVETVEKVFGKEPEQVSPMTWQKFMKKGGMDKEEAAKMLEAKFSVIVHCQNYKTKKDKYDTDASDSAIMAIYLDAIKNGCNTFTEYVNKIGK